jgi:hypothetical protein
MKSGKSILSLEEEFWLTSQSTKKEGKKKIGKKTTSKSALRINVIVFVCHCVYFMCL